MVGGEGGIGDWGRSSWTEVVGDNGRASLYVGGGVGVRVGEGAGGRTRRGRRGVHARQEERVSALYLLKARRQSRGCDK